MGLRQFIGCYDRQATSYIELLRGEQFLFGLLSFYFAMKEVVKSHQDEVFLVLSLGRIIIKEWRSKA